MRLINAKTESLEEFTDEDVPAYAILSHTWGPREVLFQDITSNTRPTHLASYQKVAGACRTALEYGLDYVWIDTCCINKESSAELSEAINSMFEWYKNSMLCFVFLVDVPDHDEIEAPKSAFRRSRWWTRGWTLQELLAPSHHIFFNQGWDPLFDLTMPYHHKSPGHSAESQLVHELAGIRPSNRPLIEAPVVVKLSWAASRETSRREDRAYCLLGLVGIQMPLLYGEGHNAFKRLLFKVMEESNSHDVFLAGLGASLPEATSVNWGLLTSSPALYRGNYLGLEESEVPGDRNAHFSITNAGLLIELPLLTISDQLSLGILNHRLIRAGKAHRLALPLSKVGKTGKRYQRLPNHGVVELRRYNEDQVPMEQIYIRTNLTESRRLSGSRELFLGQNKRVQWNVKELSDLGFEIISAYPAQNVVSGAPIGVLTFEPMGHALSTIAIASSRQFTENLAIWMCNPRIEDSTFPESCLFTKTKATSVIELLLTTVPEVRSSQETSWIQRNWLHQIAGFHSRNVPRTKISWTSDISLHSNPDACEEGQTAQPSRRVVEIFYRDQKTPKHGSSQGQHAPRDTIRARWLSATTQKAVTF